MHSVFSPGFPGLLENIYVQERLLETLMPEVYKSFVRYLQIYAIFQLLKFAVRRKRTWYPPLPTQPNGTLHSLLIPSHIKCNSEYGMPSSLRGRMS